MKNILKSNHGLTLVEVMISVMLIVILLTAAAVTMINSKLVSSLAKHKSQAAYVGQQILEQQRRLTFANIVSLPPAAITLDTRGTYNTTADDFLGSANTNVTNIDVYRKKVQVEISWLERVPAGGRITIREYYATTIANEPQLN